MLSKEKSQSSSSNNLISAEAELMGCPREDNSVWMCLLECHALRSQYPTFRSLHCSIPVWWQNGKNTGGGSLAEKARAFGTILSGAGGLLSTHVPRIDITLDGRPWFAPQPSNLPWTRATLHNEGLRCITATKYVSIPRHLTPYVIFNFCHG